MKKRNLLMAFLLMSSLVMTGCKDKAPENPVDPDSGEITPEGEEDPETDPSEEDPEGEDPTGEDDPTEDPDEGGEEDPDEGGDDDPTGDDDPVTPGEDDSGDDTDPADSGDDDPIDSGDDDSGDDIDPVDHDDDLPEPTDEDPGEQDEEEHSQGDTPVDPECDTYEFSAVDALGKKTNLDGYSQDINGFVFSFAKNDGSNNPKSEKSDGGNVFIYDKNSFTITTVNQIKKIEFSLNRTGTSMASSVGTTSVANSVLTWQGLAKEITFTATGQYRFNNVKIYYYESDAVLPVDLGEVTLAEVLDYAKDMTYTPSVDGWYLSDVSATVHVEVIDAIDSVNTGGTLDGNARGKMLAVDNSGAMMVSSSTDTTPTLSLYQRIKKWIKSGTTTYDISGRIAFFNGVPEIKVDTYKFNDSLSITKNWEAYISDTFDTQAAYLEDLEDVGTNAKGYGVNNVVRFNRLTYFNKYNSAGSYLFLDKDGKIVPAYSLLDKDKASLEEGKVYDIIGLESMYLGRPSLRILKVITNDSDVALFDLSSATTVTDLHPFFNLSLDNGGDSYKLSELTVYKADVYVSRYANDKYTFNTSYFTNTNKDYDKFTTGNTVEDAANKYSLGMFNESLDYKSIFYGWVLEEAKTTDEADARKVTIYFTLARADKVNGKNMWRVNVLEDLVPEWVE